jgi:hypothetical protein
MKSVHNTPPADEKRRMQPSFSNDMVNGQAKDPGMLMIGNNTDHDSNDNFYLECGDYLYNISNLVSEPSLKKSRSAKAPIAPVSISKQREGRIYPSRHHVESIGDVDIGMAFAIARPVQSVKSVVGFNGGRGPSATKRRVSTSGYFANSGRKTAPNSNGIVSSRSAVLINNNNDADIDHISYGIVSSQSVVLINKNNDTEIDYSYHQVDITPSSTIDDRSDRNQQCPNPGSSLKEDLNTPALDGQIEVEISPGVFALLRGSEETWRAIQTGNFETVECVCCYSRMQYIADAEYVLCSECRVVSPVGNHYRERSASGRGTRGVGLGLLAPAA